MDTPLRLPTPRAAIVAFVSLYAAAGAVSAAGQASAKRPTQTAATATQQATPAQIEAGRTRFAAQCGFCHGRDAAGGETGPDLTRSAVVAEDVGGNKIGAVVRSGRPEKGMPPFQMADADLAAIVAFIHDATAKASTLNGSRRNVAPADLDTGNAEAGKRYFAGAGGCASCHDATSTTFASVGTRYQGLALLQRMLYPGAGRGGATRPTATATVTPASGSPVTGKLVSQDEFTIALTDANGVNHSWPVDRVKIALQDPLQAHIDLLAKYTDADMHDVYAYVKSLAKPGATGGAASSGGSSAAKADSASTARAPSTASMATSANGVNASQLLAPSADSWLTYHGDYTGQRHSKLTQITPANVNQLGLAWAFQTGQTQAIKATPILANGVIYVSTPDNLWAIDARSTRQLWHYVYAKNDGFHIGHRGVAIANNLVYLTTPDAHLVALDARNGEVKWDVVLADSKRGYWSTNAPLLIRNHLLVGVSGDFDNLPGILQSFDPETGARQWTFYSTPVPGTPNSISGGSTGGQMWITGTYDPELNLVYVGTGNPTPVLNGAARPGDNPWTCSIVALNPDTGALVWGFQPSPHDTHDWDAVEVPVLVDGTFGGAPRKMLLQASRNGYFFVLDRTNGKSLLTKPFAATNWASGVDKDGRPIAIEDKEPKRDGRLIAPNEGGATNYRSPSFDPKNGLFIVSAADAYGIYFYKPEHGVYGWAGADYGIWSRGVLRAIDYQTGDIRWNHDLAGGSGSAGVLTTDSGLVFTGDASHNLLALRTSDGATLWHSGIGRVENSPITYELDGRQYLLVSGGSALYAFALPSTQAATESR